MSKIAHVTSVHCVYDNRIFEKMCKSSLKVFSEVYLVAANTESVTVPGINIVGVTIPRLRMLRSFWGSLKVILTAKRLDADIYQLYDPELLLWSFLLRLKGKAVIYDMHENVPKQLLTKLWIPKLMRWPLSRLWKLSERILIGSMPVIFAEKSYCEDYPWVKSSEILFNFPILTKLLDIEKKGEPRNRDSVVYVGRVSPERGSVRTIKALALLKEKGLDLEFICIGGMSDQHREELHRLAKQLGVRLNVKGFMKSLDALSLAKKSLLGLSVLSKIENYEYSYPTKIFEYMAIGLPIICSNIKLHSDIVLNNNCGLAVNPEDAVELADAIEKIALDSKVAEEMARNGKRMVVKNYDWSIEEQKLLAFYKSQDHCLEGRN